MSVFDSFYLLIKTNKAQAVKELGDVSKAADDLEKKLKGTSDAADDMGDRTEAAGKKVKGAGEASEEAADNADKAQHSFVELATTVGAAFAAFKVAEKLKQTISATIDYNVEVARQSKLMDMNANEVSALTSALGRLSGTDGKQALAWLTNYNAKLAEVGMGDRTKNIPQFLEEWADKLRAMSASDALTIGQRIGFTPEMVVALREGGEALRQTVDYYKQLAPLTDETAASSLRFKNDMQDLGKVAMGFANTFLPILEEILKVIGAIGAIGNAVIGKPLEWLFSLGAQPAKAVGQQASPIAQLGAVTSARAPSAPSADADANRRESFKFWLSQGYTPAQAAGLVANERAESSFNSGATGDGGSARGIFQWHADRRAAILRGTGIDVTTASHADQLRAAAWELNHNEAGAGSALRGASSAEDAGSIVSRLYERPKDQAGESFRRARDAQADYDRMMMESAQTSIATADNTPMPSTGGAGIHPVTSVTVNTVNINSPTDNPKDHANEFHKQLQIAVANADDGISH